MRGRREFLSGALSTATAGALLEGAATGKVMAQTPAGSPITNAEVTSPESGPRPGITPPPAQGGRTAASLFRLEADLADCEVEGRIPDDLNGIFFRVGPDAQFKMDPHNIPFDGEGHVSQFVFSDGRVSFRSRYARNQRYKAQAAAHRILFPMYRNPLVDDPSVKDVSRGTANTHIVFHNKLLLSLKEDSPPVAMNPLTLETVDDYHTFNGQLESKTFTAHPKIDSQTGNMVAFGYEARGFGTSDVNVFEYTPQGARIWNAWIKVPYVSMIHDFAVTRNHVVFYIIPLSFDQEQMQRGGIHWSWDSAKPTYLGFMRRGGDGSDVRWIKGPERSSTHVMGSFEDGKHLYVDVEMSAYNPFPFMPFRDGRHWDPALGASHITRLSVDLSKKRISDYRIETLYPNHVGALPRQDDRYNTEVYRYGFLPCPDPQPADRTRPANACYARFDHQTRSATLYRAGPGTVLQEGCFAPKHKNAPEGVGYLLGVAQHTTEGGRCDLLILDAEHLADGPLATVKLPTRIVGQIHGRWIPREELPGT